MAAHRRFPEFYAVRSPGNRLHHGFLHALVRPTQTGLVGGNPRGGVYDPNLGVFLTDRNGDSITEPELRSLANPETPLTYTLVPGGTGIRAGVDRDGDGWGDRTEVEMGTDPKDSENHP